MATGITKTVLVRGGSVLSLMASVVAPVVAHADDSTCTLMTSPAYQRIDPNTHSNFVTTSSTDAAAAAARGYTQNEGTPFAVTRRQEDGLRPVHQLYRRTTRDYLWTISSTEVASATARGNYVDQGVSFFAAPDSADCGVPVYRVRGFRQHRLVVGASERDALVDDGWISEGVAFYAAETDSTQPVPPTPQPPPPPVNDSSFSIAVMPDTQQEVLRASDRRFKNRTNWLVRNRSALDLRFVTSTGDVVNWDTPNHSQYEVASDAVKPLEDANIPYSLAIGNHDTAAVCAGGAACDPSQTPTLFRDTSTFNDYFTASRFGAVKGAFESGKVDNEFSTFSAGGAKWLVLVLEMWPREAAVDWAEDVVSSRPDYNVIVVTHSYLDGSGDIDNVTAGAGRTTPQWLFDNFISQHANIKLVFSGHVGTFTNRQDTGVHGNKIYSFLQTIHDSRTNPVRLVTVDTKAKTLKTWIYSPYTDVVTAGSEVNISGVSVVR